LTAALSQARGEKGEQAVLEDLLGLAALVPEPKDGPTAEAWKTMMAGITSGPAKQARVFQLRRATAQRERANPPPMISKVSFCKILQ
jgi:hypothetical protein